MLLYEFLGFRVDAANISVPFACDVVSLFDWLVPDVSRKGNGLASSADCQTVWAVWCLIPNRFTVTFARFPHRLGVKRHVLRLEWTTSLYS